MKNGVIIKINQKFGFITECINSFFLILNPLRKDRRDHSLS